MSRVDVIRDAFKDNLDADGLRDIEVIELPQNRWLEEAPADPSLMHRQFGYTIPSPGEDGIWRFFYCPEMIEDHLRPFDEIVFTRYIDAVFTHLCLHITHCDRQGTPDEVERFISELHMNALPLLAELLSIVQLEVTLR